MLIEKRLKVSKELGLTFEQPKDKQKAISLFHRSILLDRAADAHSKLKVSDRIEDLANEFPLSAAEVEISRAKSFETPVALFHDPADWWEDSQMREDFLYEDSDSLNLPSVLEISSPPPGFDTPRLRRKSIRLQIYQRIEEVNLLLIEAFSHDPGRRLLNA